MNMNVTVLDCAEVRISTDVFVGPDTSFFTPGHPLLERERRLQKEEDGRLYNREFAKPIRVEDGAWLGGNVTVLGGVTIGRGAVVAAGSVVAKDIPPYTLAAGNPCKVIRALTEADAAQGAK